MDLRRPPGSNPPRMTRLSIETKTPPPLVAGRQERVRRQAAASPSRPPSLPIRVRQLKMRQALPLGPLTLPSRR